MTTTPPALCTCGRVIDRSRTLAASNFEKCSTCRREASRRKRERHGTQVVTTPSAIQAAHQAGFELGLAEGRAECNANCHAEGYQEGYAAGLAASEASHTS